MEAVRSHVERGFYNRRDVVEATAGAVVKSRALHLLLDRYEIRESAYVPPAGKAAFDSRIAEIRRRIDDGFYDDPNNLAELAEKMIKKFGLE